MANSQLKNKQARKVLLKTWQRRTRHWPAPNPVSWWIRCQPNDGTTRPAPQFSRPEPQGAASGQTVSGFVSETVEHGTTLSSWTPECCRYSARPAGGRLPHEMRWGATMLMNSRDVITLVFFQNFGKCRWLPVTR